MSRTLKTPLDSSLTWRSISFLLRVAGIPLSPSRSDTIVVWRHLRLCVTKTSIFLSRSLVKTFTNFGRNDCVILSKPGCRDKHLRHRHGRGMHSFPPWNSDPPRTWSCTPSRHRYRLPELPELPLRCFGCFVVYKFRKLIEIKHATWQRFSITFKTSCVKWRHSCQKFRPPAVPSWPAAGTWSTVSSSTVEGWRRESGT